MEDSGVQPVMRASLIGVMLQDRSSLHPESKIQAPVSDQFPVASCALLSASKTPRAKALRGVNWSASKDCPRENWRSARTALIHDDSVDLELLPGGLLPLSEHPARRGDRAKKDPGVAEDPPLATAGDTLL